MTQLGGIGRNAPAMAALWLAGFALLIVFYMGTVRKDGPRLFWPILTLGLLLRGLFFLQLDVSNDVYRHVWEGWLQLQGINPFAWTPDAPALEPLRGGPMASIWPHINHKDYAAVYPPLTQLVFSLAAAFAPTVLAAKTAVLAFELLTLACVARLVRIRDLPDTALALYALNPLVLLYFSGEGHLDAIMAGCTAVALLCFQKNRPDWDRLGFCFLGLAGMAKFLAFALLPCFVTRRNVRGLWWAALPLVLWLPFVDAGPALLGSALQFGREMHFNDVLCSLLRPVFGAATPLAAALGLLATLTGIWLSVQERLRAAFLSSLAVLVWLPTLHPWYLLLPALLLPLFPSRTALALMVVQVWTFAVYHVEYQTGMFAEIIWLRDLAHLPVLALLVRGLWRSDALLPRRYPPPASLSVIIPVLNEGERLRHCLGSLRQAVTTLQRALPHQRPLAVEILVADGGSYDDSLDVARETRCLVIHAPRGRGRQIAAAADVARGDVLLILHADVTIHPDALVRLVHILDTRPEVVHGALGMGFESRQDEWWVIAMLNALRARCTDICFGDQAQWIRRESLRQLGGFPAQWLMEDVELSLQAKELGPAHVQPWRQAGVTASTRGWQRKGLGQGLRDVLWLFFRYLVERRLGIVQEQDPEARRYYERYYGRVAREAWEIEDEFEIERAVW